MSIQWAKFEVGINGGVLDKIWQAIGSKKVMLSEKVGISFEGSVIPRIEETSDCITLKWDARVEIILPMSLDPNIKYIEIRRNSVLIFLTVGHVRLDLKETKGDVLYET